MPISNTNTIKDAEEYFNKHIKSKKQKSKLYDYKDELLHLRKLRASFDDIVIYLQDKRDYVTTKRRVYFFLTKISPDEKTRISKRKKRSDSYISRYGNSNNNTNTISSNSTRSTNQYTHSTNNQMSTADNNCLLVSSNCQASGNQCQSTVNKVVSSCQEVSSSGNTLAGVCQPMSSNGKQMASHCQVSNSSLLESYKPIISMVKNIESAVIGSYASKFTSKTTVDDNNRNIYRDGGKLKIFRGDKKIDLPFCDSYNPDTLNIELSNTSIASVADCLAQKESRHKQINKISYDRDQIDDESRSAIKYYLNLYFCGDIVRQEYLREHILLDSHEDIHDYAAHIYDFDREFQRFVDKSNGVECIYVVYMGIVRSIDQDVYFFDYKPDESTLSKIVDRSTNHLQEQKQLIVFPVKSDKDRLVFDSGDWDGEGLE